MAKVDRVSESAHSRRPQLLAAAAALVRLRPEAVSIVSTAQRRGVLQSHSGRGSPPIRPPPAHSSAPTPFHHLHSRQHTSS